MYNESFEQYVYRVHGDLSEDSPFYAIIYDAWHHGYNTTWGRR